jgi:hypothetical protein
MQLKARKDVFKKLHAVMIKKQRNDDCKEHEDCRCDAKGQPKIKGVNAKRLCREKDLALVLDWWWRRRRR